MLNSGFSSIFGICGGSSVSWSGGVSDGSFVGRCGVGGSFVGRGGVGRGGVGWGSVGFVFLLLNVFGVLGLSFVFHISNVSVSVSLVGDDLSATIGEGNTVRSRNDSVISFLRVAHVNVGLAILNIIAEAIGLGRLKCILLKDSTCDSNLLIELTYSYSLV